jgi:restriction endonuclease S subunit
LTTTALSKICKISSGQTFREKVENNPDGDVWVIQMKDLNGSYTGIKTSPYLTTLNEVSNQQLLSTGDVLFLSRGNHNKAFVYNKTHNAVAVSLFFVLKPDLSILDPYYLAWFLNQNSTQNKLKSSQEGSTVASIKKSILENLEIVVPNLEKQKRIAHIYGLQIKEQKLAKKLIIKRELLIDQVLKEIIDEKRN